MLNSFAEEPLDFIDMFKWFVPVTGSKVIMVSGILLRSFNKFLNVDSVMFVTCSSVIVERIPDVERKCNPS